MRGGRASRSFIAAGANTNAKKLYVRVKWSSRSDGGAGYTSYELMVMDQSGAMVPPVNFTQYLRQQLCECCALARALVKRTDGLDHVPKERCDPDDDGCGSILNNEYEWMWNALWESKHFDPLPPPLYCLFSQHDPGKIGYDTGDHRLAQDMIDLILSHDWDREREVRRARILCERQLGSDALQLICSFIGEGVSTDQAIFLSKSEISDAMQTLVYEYNRANTCGAEWGNFFGEEAAWIHREYHMGSFDVMRWRVTRKEGVTEDDSDLSDERPLDPELCGGYPEDEYHCDRAKFHYLRQRKGSSRRGSTTVVIC